MFLLIPLRCVSTFIITTTKSITALLFPSNVTWFLSFPNVPSFLMYVPLGKLQSLKQSVTPFRHRKCYDKCYGVFPGCICPYKCDSNGVCLTQPSYANLAKLSTLQARSDNVYISPRLILTNSLAASAALTYSPYRVFSCCKISIQIASETSSRNNPSE